MESNPDEDLALFTKGKIVGKPPEVVDREHEKFQKRISKALKGKKSLASTKRALLEEIQEAGDTNLSTTGAGLGALAVRQFENACETHDILADERTYGSGRVGAGVQGGLVAVARFAGAYSSILDAVTNAAGPYAQVGWQTISALLIVFVTKAKNDTKLQHHMGQIERMLPRLGMWKGIYQHGEVGSEMQRLVGEIYNKVIDFSRAVAEYCCHFWTKRVWYSVVPSATLAFDEVAKSIYKVLAEVNATATVGLHARNLTILGRIDGLATKADVAEIRAKKAEDHHLKLLEDNRILRTLLNKQARHGDERQFQALKQRLNITMEHPGLSLLVTKSSLQSAFPDVDEYDPANVYSTYEHMTPQTILAHHTFQSWVHCPHSALLFIYGDTRLDGRNPRGLAASWLSPAAIHISEYLNRRTVRRDVDAPIASIAQRDPTIVDGEENVAFFSCRPDADHLEARASEVLSAIALKLVSMRKAILRVRLEDFQAIVRPGFSPQQQQQPFIGRQLSASSFGTPPMLSYPDTGGSYGGTVWTPSPQPPGLHNPIYHQVSSSDLYLLQQQQQGMYPQPTLTQLRLLIQEILEELANSLEAPPPPPPRALSAPTYASEYQVHDTSAADKYIILDRLDRADDVQISEIMIELLQLIHDNVACRVKIAVVVEQSQIEGSWSLQNLPEHLAPRDRLFDLHLNQRQLDDKVMKRARIWPDEE